MKYLVVGLGHFGASLAERLTAAGNEVIGVDRSYQRVEDLKEKISHTIQIDATDQFTMTGLPLKETDIVIVAIGEDQGANIVATALLKNLQVKRLISRAINPLHENILKAIGVDEIVHPEEETAERWAKKLCLKGVTDSFELGDKYSIVHVTVPAKYEGKTVGEINFRDKYNIVVLTSIKHIEEKSLIGKSISVDKVQGVASYSLLLEKGDLLVLYGANSDIQNFLK